MYLHQFKSLVRNLIVVLCIYQLTRLVFYFVNKSYFQVEGIVEYLQLIGYSLRYDLSVLCIINSVYIFLSLLPFSFVSYKIYQKTLNWIFISTNAISFLFDIADIAYFPFQRKRMTSEVFKLITKKSDFIDLLPSYVQTFWHIPLLCVFFIFLFYKLTRPLNLSTHTYKFSFKNLLIALACYGSTFIVIRGGLQLKPILTANALSVTTNENVALVYNTPFSLTHTFQIQKIPTYKFYTENELNNIYNPIHLPDSKLIPKKYNVVVIILESFGKSYTGISGRKSYTPCLDSIMKNGLTLTNAFANANISASGIPAILSGIPAFMEEPFTTSIYGSNKIDALPNLLKKDGYTTSFYHGGTNGTMSFDAFTNNAGFENYYGRNEYNNDKDYDGAWGIWDEPYLQYFAQQLSQKKQPFFASVFTLSSHAPFHLPKQYENTAIAKLDGIHRVIRYSDEALRKFFMTASKQSWFDNTLFVITADHNFVACHDEMGYYNNGFGLYALPVVFYKPNDSQLKGVNNRYFQQIDIMPSVLNYLQYDKPYIAFGNNAFDTIKKPFAFNYASNFNQFLYNDYLLTAIDTQVKGLYYFKQDSFLKQNLLPNDSLLQLVLPQFKAFKQSLHTRIIQNEQSISK